MARPKKSPSVAKPPLLLSPPPAWVKFIPMRFASMRLYLAWRRQRYPLVIAGGAFAAVLFFGLSAVGFFMPSRLQFSFAEPTCTFNPVLLPNFTTSHPSSTYASSSEPSLSLFGYPLLSLRTCVYAQDVPVPQSQQHVSLAPFGNPVLKKQIRVYTPELPLVTPAFAGDEAVSARGALTFAISTPDTMFSYILHGGEGFSVCHADGQTVTCPIAPLKLQQGQTYQMSLQRHFGPSHRTLLMELPVAILDPVAIIATSIAEGATVYDSPTGVTLSTDKPLDRAGRIQLLHAETGEPVASTTSELNGTELAVSFAEPLPRKTPLVLRIDQLVATDSSELDGTYELRFATSGGPMVTNINVGTTRVQPSANFVLTFDAGLLPGQDFGSIAKVSTGSTQVAARVSLHENQLTLNPNANLPRCTDFRVTVAAGLVNQYGIGDGEAWSFDGRTICQEVFSIGRSVQGRAITAYKFGTGSSLIVFVGGMHGNEKSSVATMNAWVQYLEENARKIPAHRSVVVIPNHNPDAYARSSRLNANGVDLNRNFPTPDWQSEVQIPGGTTLPHGGGMAPLDQPESAALAQYIRSNRPRLTLTYHAVARVVISNDYGDSIALGRAYASTSGYSFQTNAAADSGGTFDYATTGEFEDWVGTGPGLPALLIELASMSRNELNTHRSAMWNIVQLP